MIYYTIVNMDEMLFYTVWKLNIQPEAWINSLFTWEQQHLTSVIECEEFSQYC